MTSAVHILLHSGTILHGLVCVLDILIFLFCFTYTVWWMIGIVVLITNGHGVRLALATPDGCRVMCIRHVAYQIANSQAPFSARNSKRHW